MRAEFLKFACQYVTPFGAEFETCCDNIEKPFGAEFEAFGHIVSLQALCGIC